MGHLEGRGAVITGGSRGIGRAFARAFAAEGARLLLTARGQEDLDATLAGIREDGGEAITLVADALDRTQARAPVAAAIREFGRIDVLVNNVGGGTSTAPEQNALYTHDDGVFEADLVLNLTTVYWTSQAAAGEMQKGAEAGSSTSALGRRRPTAWRRWPTRPRSMA